MVRKHEQTTKLAFGLVFLQAPSCVHPSVNLHSQALNPQFSMQLCNLTGIYKLRTFPLTFVVFRPRRRGRVGRRRSRPEEVPDVLHPLLRLRLR